MTSRQLYREALSQRNKQNQPTNQRNKTNQRSLKCRYSIIFDLLQFLPTIKCHILLLHSNFIWLAFTKCQFYIEAMAVWCGVMGYVKGRAFQETWKPMRKHQNNHYSARQTGVIKSTQACEKHRWKFTKVALELRVKE